MYLVNLSTTVQLFDSAIVLCVIVFEPRKTRITRNFIEDGSGIF